MKFTATDGTVFTNRSEYRKYEMETQYTFRNENATTLTKNPGTVEGQPFNIANCDNCTIVILDHCDQVQIDDVTKSKVFIGASSESIFVRDCRDSTFTIACKQLRTRDCVNCTFYLYCKTEPVIETSRRMKFGCFNGAYPGHEDDMKSAGLLVVEKKKEGETEMRLPNLWYAVYDFNDELKTGDNWSLLTNEEEDELWCPLGPAENCCPRTNLLASERKHDNILPSQKEEQSGELSRLDNDKVGTIKNENVATKVTAEDNMLPGGGEYMTSNNRSFVSGIFNRMKQTYSTWKSGTKGVFQQAHLFVSSRLSSILGRRSTAQ